MRGFTSSKFYLDTILNRFDMFAITEHWLFEEQLSKCEHFKNDYTGFGVASENKPGKFNVVERLIVVLECSGKSVTLV